MARYKDVGHPLGWLPYERPSSGGFIPHWVSKRKTHKHVDYRTPPEPLPKPGPVRSLYSLSSIRRRWFGYDTDGGVSPDSTHTYIAWCMFWSVPVVELSRKLLDRTITYAEEQQLRAYLDKIPAHKPLTLENNE